ncbi:MAG: carbonic anhydrase [Pseudomonadota bacterium]|nr:carbonic anhydrase [Alphaproteobacteria bacterium]MCS5597069.1 carbonic anhydrase [Alphaproteobacteria bacterium]MEC7576899.1 carbonic anhydrase [Pseudomonadota bacterium]MEC7702315.1 carbonic anhydrase [Pseudomonadota bacterium]MEC9235614.1 carbonic anhydrase [Pseudomonadota bacterium]|tara:strand:- start:58139 stop:58873 length:735 start_codon:yes stop_codon:yes gene_type:complete
MTYRKLIKGFDAFKRDFFGKEVNADYQKLVEEGQRPETLVIACSDSRIDPALLTYSDLGQFFAIRNVAALVPPYGEKDNLHGVSAAIEYAVRALGVKHIVVLGHAGCGGINALATGNYQVEPNTEFEFIEKWLDIARHAKERIDAEMPDADQAYKISTLEQAAVIVSLHNLLSFPWIKSRCDDNVLKIHGWCFDMQQGELYEYQPDRGIFDTVDVTGQDKALLTAQNGLDFFIKNKACCASDAA